MLLAVVLGAALLRFWQLDSAPPGLYRDEAYNGLDAVGVLEGRHALYFPANNGREPLYIYLSALSIAALGRTALAVRLAAAVVGTLTTLLVYGLGRSWFDRPVGLLSALLWAATLWPLHLSRIGLRVILLPPLLTGALLLGTAAYRRRQPRLWALAGALYGVGFYSYLAFRFTPLLLLALGAFLVWRGRGRRLWPGAAFFVFGAALSLAPLALAALRDPALLGLDRTGQVSILNPEINGGSLWGTLARHVGGALGMFIWRGDDIVRHNPAGRPVFDWLLAGPWLLGVLVAARRRRQPAYAALLLWQAIMLGPTILAEDAPHFLRAVGVLPGALLVAAVGLSQLWRWSTLAGWVRWVVLLLLAFSTLLTVRDYSRYVAAPETAYLFEAAARTLAEDINQEEGTTPVYLDRRYPEGWASVPYLLRRENLYLFRPDAENRPDAGVPQTYYAWPFAVPPLPPELVARPVSVQIDVGPLARGDLEPEPYPLYIRYRVSAETNGEPRLNFDNELLLYNAQLDDSTPQLVVVSLIWLATERLLPTRKFFIHVVAAGDIVAQADFVPGHGYWPLDWHHPGPTVGESVPIALPTAFDPDRHSVLIGMYDAITGDRVTVRDADGRALGDTWAVPFEESAE